MNKTFSPKTAELYPGMGQAVAERTILRKDDRNIWETWGDVAERVAKGNTLLTEQNRESEYQSLRHHLRKATVILSGRHLQHGDESQPTRDGALFTNCCTAPTSFLSFSLLLCGSGVGRLFDNDLMLVNWDNAPHIRCVLSENHPDFDYSAHESVREARHKYKSAKDVIWYEVEDSREGWGKSLEIWETLAFEKIHKDKLLILDFSKVRPRGTPIKGMQNRPASGPTDLMNAFSKAAKIRGAGIPKWMQAMFIDHYFAECVVVGGARRAARIACMNWKEKDIFDFIRIKRPIEYQGIEDGNEILRIRKELGESGKGSPQGFLWSANNSVIVDNEFWDYVEGRKNGPLANHALEVFNAAVFAGYFDGTGEPGFINADKLVCKTEGLDKLFSNPDYIGSSKYVIEDDTKIYMSKLSKAISKKKYQFITNPCGEIVLHAVAGGYCVIGDVVPFHADDFDEAEDAFRTAAKALIRANLMPSIYGKEVKRTNRIGVGITGIHEFAWKFFGYTFRDLIDESKSQDFWNTIERFRNAVIEEVTNYCKALGVTIPHTIFTIKPSGSVSKLFGLSEGWHLPSMREYLRWVQFRSDDPLVNQYAALGYPNRKLTSYPGVTIIGFPTQPLLCTVRSNKNGNFPEITTASEATIEEQYLWLMLGEKYWINGTNPETTHYGNQISYTMKYTYDSMPFDKFKETIKKYQSKIKCATVMPQDPFVSYEYQPEEPITKEQYRSIVERIGNPLNATKEDIGFEHIDCSNNGCPVDFKESK